MKTKIKSLIEDKKKINKKQHINSSFSISTEKYKRMTSKLTKINKSSKSYLSQLETTLDDKKIPLISPLLHEDNFAIDFEEKANFFIRFLGPILWLKIFHLLCIIEPKTVHLLKKFSDDNIA